MCANIRIILDFRGCVRPAPPENRAILIFSFRRAGAAPLFRPVPAIRTRFAIALGFRYLCSRKHRFRMNTVSKYLSLVKFAHTIFAMPFAAVGFVYAYATLPAGAHDAAWWLTRAMQVLLCMVFARNTAMGFNRWADRRIDAENPRTAGREIPAGVIPPRHALRFVAVNALLFIAAASTINLLTALLSPVALFIILFYSYCKRFTALAHLVLGLSLGIAPVGAYIAVTGRIALEPCILSLLVMTWCGGFDIIYALQDAAFDREIRPAYGYEPGVAETDE